MITCIICGCSEFEPCIDGATGETCAWLPGFVDYNKTGADREASGLCTFCAEEAARERIQCGIPPFDGDEDLIERDAPLVELVSEGEADRFLRARRAGA